MANHVRFALASFGLSVAISTSVLAATHPASASAFAQNTQCGDDKKDEGKKNVAAPQCGDDEKKGKGLLGYSESTTAE